MAIAHFILGIAMVALGSTLVLRRERIVASHRQRSAGSTTRPPMAWLVGGTILTLAGLIQVLRAFQ